MALNASGQISLAGSTVGQSIACELKRSGTGAINLNETDVRKLGQKTTPSSQISLNDFWGKSSGPPLGQAYCGGYYMAALWGYYIIVAPNATGCACCQWKTTATGSGTASLFDGYTNTYPALNNTTHPAGNFTATRSINGFSDWYLPAIDELQQIYLNGGKDGRGVLPAGESYAANLYWSSTEFLDMATCGLNFNVGGRTGYLTKTNSLRTRAVRREPI